MFDKELMAKAEKFCALAATGICASPPPSPARAGCRGAAYGNSRIVERHRAQFCHLFKSRQARSVGRRRDVLKQHGAVSEPVMCAMAQNTFDMTTAHLTVAVSGIAGPGGGSDEACRHRAYGDRDKRCHPPMLPVWNIGRANVRLAALHAAADMLLARLKD